LVGLALPLVILTATLVVGSSLLRLTDDARLSGGTWDAFLDVPDQSSSPSVTDVLDADASVAGWTRGGWNELDVEGSLVFAFLLEPGRGLDPSIVTGRAPTTDNEIALGAAVMHRIGVSIGDDVNVALSANARGSAAASTGEPVVSRTLRVVGEAIVSSSLFQSFAPDESAVVTTGLSTALGAQHQPVLVAFHKGIDAQAGLDDLLERSPEGAVQFSFARSTRGDIFALKRLIAMVAFLDVVVAAMAAATLAHQILVGTRRQQRAIGVLRTLGFTRRQLSTAGAVHGLVVAAIPCAIGIPIGVVAGRAVWRLVSQWMVVLPRPVVSPGIVLGLVGLATIAVTVTGAAVARRYGVGTVSARLRAE
jgi:hypothetical protein